MNLWSWKLGLGLLAAAALSPAAPRIVYTKSFPGSSPAYVYIAVDEAGKTEYKETPDDDPETFVLEGDVTRTLFDLAGKLDHFRGTIESGLKVANMGSKTFRWENGAEASEAKYNYSVDVNAQAMQDIFDRISDSERLFVELRRVIRHDRLGVHQALIRIEALWNQKKLVGGEQFLPLFDRVAKDEQFIHMARQRAATIAEGLRAGAN